VTSLEYRLHEVGPEVFFLMTIYPADSTRDGLRVFREVMPDAPEELMVLGILWTAGHEEPVPEAWQGQPVFVVVGVWSGPPEQGEEATRALREIAEPIVDLSGPTPFEAAQQAFDPEYPDGRRYYWKSIYLPELDDAAIETLVASAAARPSPLSSVDVWALGGAMSREPAGGSAFARRGDPFLLGIEANWDEPDEDEANVGWARALFDEIAARAPGATYLNFGGFAEEGEALLAETYGPTYARLQELKATYDPDNVFRSTFNIAPTAG
jgi:FAD/FMN-containing dehydrogenase